MPPIGETLREARLRRRIDIAEVEQATKIRSKYLRALEAEEFDRLPGSTFVRTFLRTYADYLGLDSQLLVEEYRASHETPEFDEAQPLTPPPASQPRAREGRRRSGGPLLGRGATIAAAIIAILALLLVIGLLGGGGEEDQGAEERAASADGEQGAQRAEGGGGAAEEESDVVSLRIEPAAETYVCVENAKGEELINANVTAPETIEGRSLRVLLGNTLAIEATANGEPLELVESADPVGLEVTPDGDRELSAGELPCQ